MTGYSLIPLLTIDPVYTILTSKYLASDNEVQEMTIEGYRMFASSVSQNKMWTALQESR